MRKVHRSHYSLFGGMIPHPTTRVRFVSRPRISTQKVYPGSMSDSCSSLSEDDSEKQVEKLWRCTLEEDLKKPDTELQKDGHKRTRSGSSLSSGSFSSIGRADPPAHKTSKVEKQRRTSSPTLASKDARPGGPTRPGSTPFPQHYPYYHSYSPSVFPAAHPSRMAGAPRYYLDGSPSATGVPTSRPPDDGATPEVFYPVAYPCHFLYDGPPPPPAPLPQQNSPDFTRPGRVLSAPRSYPSPIPRQLFSLPQRPMLHPRHTSPIPPFASKPPAQEPITTSPKFQRLNIGPRPAAARRPTPLPPPTVTNDWFSMPQGMVVSLPTPWGSPQLYRVTYECHKMPREEVDSFMQKQMDQAGAALTYHDLSSDRHNMSLPPFYEPPTLPPQSPPLPRYPPSGCNI